MNTKVDQGHLALVLPRHSFRHSMQPGVFLNVICSTLIITKNIIAITNNNILITTKNIINNNIITTTNNNILITTKNIITNNIITTTNMTGLRVRTVMVAPW